MFPFLIGRIRTFPVKEDQRPPIEFPFLIGRIRTEKINEVTMTEKEFPFLIGRIRTNLQHYNLHLTYLVSIPHR